MQRFSVLALATLIPLLGCGGSAAGPPPPPPQPPGPPASIVIYAGNSQTSQRGATLPDPLCTNVLDAAGHLLRGIKVTYTVTTGGGQLGAPTEPSTDNNGIATSGLWKLGSAAGQQKVTASSPGAGSVTFTAYAN